MLNSTFLVLLSASCRDLTDAKATLAEVEASRSALGAERGKVVDEAAAARSRIKELEKEVAAATQQQVSWDTDEQAPKQTPWKLHNPVFVLMLYAQPTMQHWLSCCVFILLQTTVFYTSKCIYTLPQFLS